MGSVYALFCVSFGFSFFVFGRPAHLFPLPGTGRRLVASHFQATARSVEELQQAVLSRLQAAQFFRRANAQFCM